MSNDDVKFDFDYFKDQYGELRRLMGLKSSYEIGPKGTMPIDDGVFALGFVLIRMKGTSEEVEHATTAYQSAVAEIAMRRALYETHRSSLNES